MRLKQTGALLLASAMIVGSVGMMNPTEVRAAGETNTFTLTVPADTSITQSGWNDIGNVGVSNVSIESGKEISVTIENGATGRTLKKTGDASKTVGYEVKKGTSASNEAFGTSLEFEANGTQALGAVVADFSTAEVGTYEDTINFTAELASAAQGVEYTLTGSSANSKKLTSTALLASSNQTTVTYDGKSYTAYNGYISETSGANWNDGVAFVAALNEKEIDGRTGGWTLLTSKEMAYAWWITTDPADNKGASSFGGVNFVWTGGSDGDYGYYAGCGMAADNGSNVEGVRNALWSKYPKTISASSTGFVVLRGSSNAPAPTAADVFKENAELVMKLVETNDSFFVLTYKNIGGSFVVQSIFSSQNGDITGVYGSACTIANNNPSFTFIFGMESDTMTLNTSTLEYTRTGRTPPMTSFVVDGVELIDTLTDKTN